MTSTAILARGIASALVSRTSGTRTSDSAPRHAVAAKIPTTDKDLVRAVSKDNSLMTLLGAPHVSYPGNRSVPDCFAAGPALRLLGFELDADGTTAVLSSSSMLGQRQPAVVVFDSCCPWMRLEQRRQQPRWRMLRKR